MSPLEYALTSVAFILAVILIVVTLVQAFSPAGEDVFDE